MADEGKTVRSPIPGVFYRKPEPAAPEFVQEGDQVEAGTVVGLVEVMKQFHELPAGVSGTIAEFLVENEGTVEAGQVIARLD